MSTCSKRVELERLGDEVGGPLLDRVDRVLDRAVAGDDDGDDLGVALERGFEDLTTVDTRQPQVGDEHVEREFRQPPQRRLAALGLFDDEPVVGQAFGDRLAQRALVVDDQQMFRGIRHLVGLAVF